MVFKFFCSDKLCLCREAPKMYRHDSHYSYRTLIKTQGETTICFLYIKRKNKHRPKFRKGKGRKLSGGRACYSEQYCSFHIFFSFLCSQKKQLPVRARLVLCHFLLSVTMVPLFLLYLTMCCEIQPLSYMVSERGFSVCSLSQLHPMDKS